MLLALMLYFIVLEMYIIYSGFSFPLCQILKTQCISHSPEKELPKFQFKTVASGEFLMRIRADA